MVELWRGRGWKTIEKLGNWGEYKYGEVVCLRVFGGIRSVEVVW